MLAGISAEYYVRLERGRDRHPSTQVVDALARVLHLDPESRSYLATLATSGPPTGGPGDDVELVPDGVRALVDAAAGPAFVLGRFTDVLTANVAADRLHGGRPANMVRHVFLDPVARERYPDWEDVAAETVATLRGAAAGHHHDPRLVTLVGELALADEHFRRLWARHDVRTKTAGVKRIRTPEAGVITLTWEALAVSSAPGQVLVTYGTEPGSTSAQRLAALVGSAGPDRGPA